MKKRYLIILCSVFYLNIFSQIANDGVLHVATSTTVYFGDEYTNNGIHNSEGNVYFNSNFINNDSTSATSGTTFFNSSANDIQIISGSTNNINFYNLEIDNGLIGVQVVDNFGVFVTNGVNLKTGDLRLSGEAQLIQSHSGTDANTSISGKLLRDQQGNFSPYAINYWSSPVNNGGTFSISGGVFDGTDSDLNQFAPQQVLFNLGAPFNGVPSIVDEGDIVSTPLTLNSSWFYKYQRGSGTVARWIKINENSPLNPGEGFLMKGTNTSDPTQNYVFKGVPNDGLYQFPINIDEYLLLGNPYPSAIDVDEFIKDNISISEGGYAANDAINGTLYYWVDGGSTSHNYSGYYGGYATRNLTSGAPPSVSPITVGGLGTSEFALPPTRYMAIAQGFFVVGAGNSNIILKNSQRAFITESSGESVHYKTINNKTDTENSYVRIGYEDPEGFHRQLVLGFLPNTTANLNYNIAYDALMFGSREDELYFIIENDSEHKYVIQGVGAFDESYEFPLGLKITEEGDHTIMLDSVENFSNTVYIKDNLLNITYNLSQSNFEPNLPTGEYYDRFQLVFQSNNALDINEFERNNINVYYDGNNNIIISNQNSIRLTKVSIYNILGQNILQIYNSSLGDNKITVPFRNKEGVYLVKIRSEIGEGTFKILKYK